MTIPQANKSNSEDRPIAVLIGAPGAGKSSVGRLLARRLDAEFIDTDALIVERAGKPVSDIFIEDGEPHFRTLEADALREALTRSGAVVSLGGGAIVSEENRRALRDHHVVWLKVSPGQAASRVGLSGARPLLMGNVRGRLVTLLQERTPWYADLAEVTVDTDDRTVEDIVEEVSGKVLAS